MEAFTQFLVTTSIRLLEGIFVFGVLGSALVVILAGVEDLREIAKRTVPGKEEAD